MFYNATKREVWEAIRKRPGMYTGGRSGVSELYYFLNGWSLAVAYHGIEDGDLWPKFGFRDWVAYRLHKGYHTGSWCHMLLEKGYTEEAALERFFELHDEYEQRVPREFAYSEPITRFTEWTGKRQERVEHVGRLRLVTYTDDPGFFIKFDAPTWTQAEEFRLDLSEGWVKEEPSLTVCDQDEYERLVKETKKRAEDDEREFED